MIKFTVLLNATLLVLYATLLKAIKRTFWCMTLSEIKAPCLQE